MSEPHLIEPTLQAWIDHDLVDRSQVDYDSNSRFLKYANEYLDHHFRTLTAAQLRTLMDFRPPAR